VCISYNNNWSSQPCIKEQAVYDRATVAEQLVAAQQQAETARELYEATKVCEMIMRRLIRLRTIMSLLKTSCPGVNNVQ